MTVSLRAWLRRPYHVFAIVAGITVPLVGYFWMEYSQVATGLKMPLWVRATIPLASLGSQTPSVLEFTILALLNVVIWTTFILGIGRIGRKSVGA